MKRGWMKRLRALIRSDKAPRPEGYTAEQWTALRDAHSRGLVVYGNAAAMASWPDQHGSEPLFLAHGCKRCGEPLDARASGEVCSPCVVELSAKPLPPPPVQAEWWHSPGPGVEEEEKQLQMVVVKRAA